MLLRLIKYYVFIAGILYFAFWFKVSSEYISLYVVHIITFITYGSILYFISKKGKGFYSKNNLTVLVLLYSLVLVISYNITSYIYNNNLFVFSEADAVTYYYHSLNMASKSISDSIYYYLSYYRVDDLGAVLVSSTLYRIIESKLILNFFYIIVGLITAIGIYRISTHFMSLKYAFICAVSYSLSSFVLWFHASGLKESFMCMLIVLFFDRYYLYLQNKNILHIVYGSLFLAALLLFRPPLTFFALGAIAMGMVLQKRKGLSGAFIIILAFVAFVGLYPVFQSTYDRFLMGGDINRLLMAKQSMIIVSTRFTYATNFLAQLIGPLPTISPDTKELLSFFSPGLIYKVLLSVFFWFGVFYVFKIKKDILYPLIFFAFFEMISLLLILEGLELRKSLPHFFVIYIIAFWFLDKFDMTQAIQSVRSRQKTSTLFSFSSAIVLLIIFIWNIRYGII